MDFLYQNGARLEYGFTVDCGKNGNFDLLGTEIMTGKRRLEFSLEWHAHMNNVQ